MTDKRISRPGRARQRHHSRQLASLLLLLVALLATLPAQAQALVARATGRVVDATTGEPLIGATVQLLLMADTTVRSGGATDATGAFAVQAARGGSYVLRISFLGYTTVQRGVALPEYTGTIDVGTVRASAAAIALGTATVTGRTPPVVQRGDTAQYNANAFKTNPDADARALITKMPGISVDADGKVQAQGETVQRVLVDGKEFFGDDPDAVLKNLPAEAIDKIQVFDRQSEQSQFSGFNDGNTQKTINIVTKPQYRSGQFGRLVAGGGPERYKTSLSLNSFEGDRRVALVAQRNNVNEQNFSSEDLAGVAGAAQPQGGGSAGGRGGRGGGGGGGGNVGNFLVNQRGGISTTHAAGLNYTDKLGARTDLTASYFFNFTDNLARTDLARQYVLPAAAGQRYAETATKTAVNQNHRVSLRFEHKFDSANTLLWTPRLSWQHNRSASQQTGRTLLADTLRSTVRSAYSATLTAANLGGELLFRHRFARRGRTLSLGATPSYTSKTGPSNLLATTTTGEEEQPADSALDQRAALRQRGWGLATNVAFTEPLGAHSQVQASYAFSYAPSESAKQTFDRAGPADAYTALNPTLSSVFTNQYLTHGTSLTYRYNDKKFQGNVGLTGQYAQLTGDQTYPFSTRVARTFYSLLPAAQVRLKLSPDRNLRLNYNARTNAPSISQLQEVVNNANPLQLTTGNPALAQEMQHNAFVRYSAANPERATTFFALAAAAFTQNYLTSSTLVAMRDTVLSPTLTLPAGAQLTRPVNLDGRLALRTFASYGMPLKALKSTLNLNATATYARTPGLVNGGQNYARTPALSGGLTLASNISERLDFTLSSNTSVTAVRNTLRVSADNQYLNQATSLRFNLIVGPGFTFQTDISHQLYKGLSAGFDQNYFLWNASLGKKLFANQRGELKLYVYDLLKQNQSIQRTITEAYVEDQRANILQRYALVMFTYNLRRGTGTPTPADRTPDSERRPPRGGGGSFGPPSGGG